MSFPEFIEVLLLLQLLYYGTKQENPFNFPHFLPLAALYIKIIISLKGQVLEKSDLKGTVRPDWIWMRVVPLESPLKGHQPLSVFDFLISVLNIWNNFKVLRRFMQNWTQPPACSDHGLYRILSSYWLAHFYLMKKSAKELLYFGLDCIMM